MYTMVDLNIVCLRDLKSHDQVGFPIDGGGGLILGWLGPFYPVPLPHNICWPPSSGDGASSPSDSASKSPPSETFQL